MTLQRSVPAGREKEATLKIASAPIRTCTGCRERRPQGSLVRVCRLADGTVAIAGPGSSGRAQGRGAYVCPREDCIVRSLKTGSLQRGLRGAGPLPGDLRERLLDAIGSS